MIEAKNLSMYYGRIAALDRVSFSAKGGEILGLLGPNGAGKTTVMKILTTFIYPTSGTASIGGHEVTERPLEVRRMIGYLPEIAPLYVDMRVEEYLHFVASARGLSGNGIRGRMGWVSEACGIRQVLKHTVSELSRGFRQRVGLAQALIHDPQVLILDEPTTGLDPLQIIDIRRLIKDLARKKTILFSTHVLQEASALSDRIVIIHEGRVISQGTLEELEAQAMGRRLFSLSIAGEGREIEASFRAMASVEELRSAAAGDGLLTIEIVSREPEGFLQDFNALLRQKNWTLREFREKRFSLEETFIALLNQAKSAKGREN